MKYIIDLPVDIDPITIEGLINQLVGKAKGGIYPIQYEKTLYDLKNKPIKIYKGFDYENLIIKCQKCGSEQKLIELLHRGTTRNCSICINPILKVN